MNYKQLPKSLLQHPSTEQERLHLTINKFHHLMILLPRLGRFVLAEVFRAFPRDLIPERRLMNIHAYNLVDVILMSVRERLVTKSRWRLKVRKSITKKNTITSKMEFHCFSNKTLEISREVLRLASSLWGKLWCLLWDNTGCPIYSHYTVVYCSIQI